MPILPSSKQQKSFDKYPSASSLNIELKALVSDLKWKNKDRKWITVSGKKYYYYQGLSWRYLGGVFCTTMVRFSVVVVVVEAERETTSEQSQTLSWFIVAGEISLERQNLAHRREDTHRTTTTTRRKCLIFFSSSSSGSCSSSSSKDLRSNYFCYQSRSVRWLYKELLYTAALAKKERRRFFVVLAAGEIGKSSALLQQLSLLL